MRCRTPDEWGMACIASQSVRERAIAAYESGQGSQQDVAAMFGIHLRTFQRWLGRARKDGEFAPRPRGHRRPAFDGPLLTELDELVSSNPDITLGQIAEHFSRRVTCSLQAVHNALSRLDWRYKKSRYERASKIDST